MAKYLVVASYTTEGIRGVKANGGTARREAVEKTVASLGGRVEAFYFGFGSEDAFVLLDLPDNTTAAAMGLAVVVTADEPRRINGVVAHDSHEHFECRMGIQLIDAHS